MSYTATVLKVMIASPSDVRAERVIAQSLVYEWNVIHSGNRAQVLLPVAWETHSAPALGLRAQEIINRQLVSGSDMLVAVFWTRLGTPTGDAASGTVEEIERHLKDGKPVMLYFSNQPVRLDSIDSEQYQAMKEFKKSALTRGLVEEYDSHDQFRDKFSRQLAQTIIERFPPSAAPDDPGRRDDLVIVDSALRRPVLSPADRELLNHLADDARQFLASAAKDRNGMVLVTETMGGTSVETNGKEFAEQGNVRSERRWRRAVQDLVQLGLLKQSSPSGEVFEITHEGFRVVDLIAPA